MKSFVCLSAAICLLAACGKDKTTTPATPPPPRVKSESNPANGVAYNYEYDAQGRITKRSKTPGQQREEYTYVGSAVTETGYQADGSFGYTTTHQLNADGLAIKTSESPSSPDYITYTYNSNKQIQKRTTVFSGNTYVIDYYYTGDRLDSSVARDAAGLISLVDAFEYYNSTSNSLGNLGYSFYGKKSPQAFKKRLISFYNAGVFNNSQEYNYAYELDAQNRISKWITSGYASGVAIYMYY